MRFIAGSLAFTGTALGLMFAGATDICAMALFLAKMPCNNSSCDK